MTRGYVVVAAALLAAGVSTLLLMGRGPVWLENRAITVYEREQRLLAQQAAQRIRSVVDDTRRRLADPMLHQASGILGATGEDLTAALVRLQRDHDQARGVQLLVHDAQGRVLAVDGRMPGPMKEQFSAHIHHDENAAAWENGVGVCTKCLTAMRAVSVAEEIEPGVFLAANINAAALAAHALRDSFSVEGGSAWLLDERRHALYGVGTAPLHSEAAHAVSAEVPVGDLDIPWLVRVAVPRANIAPSIRGGARRLFAASAGILAFICIAGLGLLVWMRRMQLTRARELKLLYHQDKLATLGQLAAAVGHEINNALTAAFMYAGMLRGGRSDTEDNDHEQLDAALVRLRGLSGDLLGYARQDADEKRPVRLGAAVAEAMRVVQPKLKNGPEVVMNVGEHPPVSVIQGQLVQVLVNLLLNAAHAAPDDGKGRVTIGVGAHDGRARICVIDNGPGIPADTVPDLFRAFYTTKPDGEGTGLGLWLCQKIVRQHGGEIVVTEAPGGGARFSILLPPAVAAMTIPAASGAG